MSEKDRDFTLLCDLPEGQLITLGQAVTRFVERNVPVVTAETLYEAADALEDESVSASDEAAMRARRFAAFLRSRARWLTYADDDD